ncbi:HdeD family acid-resistance protein [Streptomyces sp. NPDC052682]|uniref:HdeD family acid-resistance protein n=1 Tax=Streptomyces sp. NPDC052682 TaxID=3154954 RepID=UPI0034292B16
MRRQLMWMLVLRGGAALLFGVIALVWPAVTVVALALLFGAYALLDGVALLVSAVRRKGDQAHRLAHAAAGVLGIAAGVFTIAWPGVTALGLVVLAGAWSVITGVAELWAAVRFRRELHHEWALFAAGGASVLAGLLLWARPEVGAITIAQIIGVYALLSGGLLLTAARHLHGTTPAARLTHHARHA